MRLTLVALGMLAVAGAASAQAPSCNSGEPRQLSLYFERDRAELNDFSKAMVDRVANEARRCGLTEVVAETEVDAKRAAVISDTFQSRGVQVILVGPTTPAPRGDEVADRAAKLWVTLNRKAG